jgi:hypothetical protein
LRKAKFLSIAVAFGALSSFATANWYTSEATFVGQLQGPYYLEQFNGWTFGNPLNGSQTTWAAPGANGYGFTAAAPQGLWSNPGALSTNNANDPITLTFTGNPVTAWGALVAGTDINGNAIQSNISITLSNGQVHNMASSAFTFIGWANPNVTLTSVVIDTTAAVNSWPAIDNNYVGAAVPEPGTMIALGLGAAALLRRRARKAA